MGRRPARADVLETFHGPVRDWFAESFPAPTPPQVKGWPAIARGDSTLLLAPTGTGKTLAAFMACIDRLMFALPPEPSKRCRVLYVSPLKALAVDVERNLRAPLIGISRQAQKAGVGFHLPTISIRTGDTPPSERARFVRAPSDILITTPESLYLLLTSNAREVLRSVETVIIDEIHALVPTKRGAHLALSLERLQSLVEGPLQRVGLSATQRPLEEVAGYLGGANVEAAKDTPRLRPVTIVDAGARKQLELRIDVPVEDMARLGKPVDVPSGPASQGPVRASIWTAIHPRLLELIRAHQTTLIFVNSRRVAERLAGALNELAGEVLVQAHHGSIARDQRMTIEDNLKLGRIRGLVATSSLELGIDMGAIDLVVQIEAPPTVASGMQRIGRAGHQVDAPSRGVVFPKYRSDLVACAALARAMQDGEVEQIHYPRNPLDVLAQQLVAMVSMDPWDVDALYAFVRRAAPYANLSRGMFDGVLDMLAGRYVSDEFAELKPRLTWDRTNGTLKPREGARRVAVINGGTIPDRGLYGVFLAGAQAGKARVGELDEEMVFESRPGETFILGASTWRIEEITHDRVLVSPAPGEPGKMPFWHGDSGGRSVELGRRIGELVRQLRALPDHAAREQLQRAHGLEPLAAENLLRYLADQAETNAQAVPDDRTIVVERTRDELGDWRICLLSPLGGQVLAPWSMAVTARARALLGQDVEAMWTNDGFVIRIPESDTPPDPQFLFPEPEEVEQLVIDQLGGSALFAAKFRECAARALLLPRRMPGRRTPLWQQRKRASDLLASASKYSSFPITLEAYRECLRDVFDLPELVNTLRGIQSRAVRVVTLDSETPSPFAASILFGFIANYIYEGDAPLAERRAQALAIDPSQLRELLGDLELRDLLNVDALAELERQLQHLTERTRARSPDALHDLLLRLGDLSPEEVAQRCSDPLAAATWIDQLVRERRAIRIRLGGTVRIIAVEDVARFRDAFGVALPPGLPQAFLADLPDALEQLAMRYARTHVPFTTGEFAQRYGVPFDDAEQVLERLNNAGRLLEGAFRPGGRQREWCHEDVLRRVRQRSLAALRREVEPVEPAALGRFASTWHGLLQRRVGLDALLDTIEKLQGYPMPASRFEKEILAARIEGYSPADLDALASAGEVVWVGVEPLGERDGRIALYLTDQLRRLRPPPAASTELAPLEARLLDVLRAEGASFYFDLQALVGGFPADLVDALWGLVWKGLVTNDTFHALRSYTRPKQRDRRLARASARGFRSRRALPPTAGGRWSLVAERSAEGGSGVVPSTTEWAAAIAWQLLTRYGIVTREVATAEGIPGGFSSLHDVFVGLEGAGRVRRGYFVSGVGAMQFALPEVLDILRSAREPPERAQVVVLAATDPANPYGALLRWPELNEKADGGALRPARAAGAKVVLFNGALAGHLSKGGRQLLVWLPEDEPDRSAQGEALGQAMARLGNAGDAVLIEQINGGPAPQHALAPFLLEAGFTPSSHGLYLSRRTPLKSPVPHPMAPAREAGVDEGHDEGAEEETEESESAFDEQPGGARA